jgi:hypothetical protein
MEQTMLKFPIVAFLANNMYILNRSVGHDPGTSCALARHVGSVGSGEMQA